MSLDTGRGRLYAGWKTIQEHWDDTKQRWRDMACRDFEEEFWQPLQPRVVGALSAIDRLAQLIDRIKHECR